MDERKFVMVDKLGCKDGSECTHDCMVSCLREEMRTQSRQGYEDGGKLEEPMPSGNRHPAYIHGFKNGRDDEEVSRKMRRFPARTAQQCRDDWAYIEVTCGEE